VCNAFDTSMPHSFNSDYIIGYVKAHTRVNERGCWIFTGPRGGGEHWNFQSVRCGVAAMVEATAR
jgi:hypothetical protein